MNYVAKDITVLIPTYNRPQQIKECLQSIRTQTKPPLEVVIVDASEDFASQGALEEFGTAAFNIQYIRSRPNKIEQRNYGLRYVKGSLVQLSDDDIVFERDYFEKLIESINQLGDPQFGGAIGRILQHRGSFSNRVNQMIGTIFSKCFLLPSIGDGHIRKSGYTTYVNYDKAIKFERRIGVLNGAACYKRNVFEAFQFDVFFNGYCYDEDSDLSLSVGLKHNLYYLPRPCFVHNHLRKEKVDPESYYYQMVYNHYYMFCKYQKPYHLSWVAFWWANLGVFLYVLLFTRSLSALKGVTKGFKALIVLKGEK